MHVNNEKKSLKDNFKSPKINPFMIVIGALVVWSILSAFVFTPSKNLSALEKRIIPVTEVINKVKNGEVEKILISDGTLKVTLKNGDMVSSDKEPEISFYEMLALEGVDESLIPGGIKSEKKIPWMDLLIGLLVPIALVGGLIIVMTRAGKTAGGIFGLGKSKAKLFNKGEHDIGFKDVAGAHEIKDELVEIVDFLKKPQKYQKLGARIPKGILLVGPAGVGKTLLARAIAGEAGVPFYSVAGSEFIEMIVGVGSARVRDLFRMAKETAPSLIFIDEIDAIGRQRGRNAAVSNDEREQTLNQILVEMDGFDPRSNVIILGATNRPDMLDSALIRPGRFDRLIRINLPDVEEREEIIKIHMKGKPFDKEVDTKTLARRTVGFSGADIENMLNEAAILAARKSATKIVNKDLTEASTKVKLGPERRLLQSDDEKKVVAYHEAGHALVAAKSPHSDSVGRISIISRSMSLGHTEFVPQDNVYNQTKSKLLASIRSALGGRAAEELVFNQETVGASNDIERATVIARRMVTDFGMSSLGPINYINSQSAMWDASMQDMPTGYSEEVAKQIDAEVRRIIETEYRNALETLKKNRKILDKLADELLDKETLEQDEFEKIIEG